MLLWKHWNWLRVYCNKNSISFKHILHNVDWKIIFSSSDGAFLVRAKRQLKKKLGLSARDLFNYLWLKKRFNVSFQKKGSRTKNISAFDRPFGLLRKIGMVIQHKKK